MDIEQQTVVSTVGEKDDNFNGAPLSMGELGQSYVHIDPAAERKLRLKIDLAIVPMVSVMYLFCFIDRANLGNAKIAGMDKELRMKGYDYNVVITFFYISYILFEIPATMLCKYIGPGWFLPLTTILFGVASLGTAWVHTVPQASGVRFVLGVFEAGMMPGIAYYLSRWYRRAELAFRISLYVVMSPLAGAFGGLLAYAILRLDSFGNLREWRMLFAIEGLVTIVIGLLGLVLLTDRPETARWLTAEEKALAVERVRSERVGTTKVLEEINGARTLRGILNPITLSTATIFLLNNVTVQGLAFFLPTIVGTIYSGATVVELQLRTAPPYLVGAFFTVLFPGLSWRLDRRNMFFIICAPLTMVGYLMFLCSHEAKVRYAATFLVALSVFPFAPLANGQVSANVVSDTARSAAIGTNVMLGNIGGLVSGWSFLPWDGPDYRIGNGLNLGTSSTVLVLALGLFAWEQIEDLDWKHPDFEWRL
ncbi:hypothetical protein VTK73DRAFT_5048 [Phialemonium thermophilum]|uniref:Major facilitator superfamily (MFS) profile domain-containing protein n=1 Tax=Phialemonium thermophilum TaxID=223376 RepID=A0ABR3WQ64_9PEZI